MTETPPGVGSGPHTLQILTTEHWSLLAARSLETTQAMSRASIFIAALSGAVVALALVAQATNFGAGFVAFALVLLPVVYFLGLATVARLGQINLEDARWMQGMNRIRHAYLELSPELEPYFVSSPYDEPGRPSTVADRRHQFVAGDSAVPRDSWRHRRCQLCRRRRHCRNRWPRTRPGHGCLPGSR